jgi:hypothetical protein
LLVIASKKCDFVKLKSCLNEKGQIWAEVSFTKTKWVPWPVNT